MKHLCVCLVHAACACMCVNMILGSVALRAEWKIVIILNLECKYIFRTDQVSVMKVKGSLDKCIKIWCHLVGELER